MSITVETKEEIRARMLSRVSDSYDKTEGSFFWDMLDPVAAETVTTEENIKSAVDDSFVATAEGEELDCVVFDRKGMMRKSSTKAVGTVTIKGVAGKTIPVGVAVAADTVEFYVTENGVIDEDGTARVPILCTVGGKKGNVAAGAIKSFPVSYTGLYSVTNENATSGGTDSETDAELRERCYSAMRDPGTSGNVSHYREWATSVAGIGDARVIPVWNGNGTVKVVLVGTGRTAVDAGTVEQTRAYIETKRPIGANVTVESAKETPIDIAASVTLTGAVLMDDVTAAFTESVEQYLRGDAFSTMQVLYSKIGALLSTTVGVADYQNLTLNGSCENIELATEELGTVGAVNLSSDGATNAISGTYSSVVLVTGTYTTDVYTAVWTLNGSRLKITVDMREDKINNSGISGYAVNMDSVSDYQATCLTNDSGAILEMNITATTSTVPENIVVTVYRSTNNVTITMTGKTVDAG